MSSNFEVERALTEAHRREWGSVLAATTFAVRDLDLAEESVQEAYATALVSWTRDGVPNNPAAWLTTTAKRRAFDALRRRSTLQSKLPLLVVSDEMAETAELVKAPEQDVGDEQLRLIFMCCHPALAPESQAALTMRLVRGASVADIARLFLVSESTMAARLTRAKHKIAKARIPVRVPRAPDLAERLQGVLGVIHLLFTMGHTAPSGSTLMRGDLADESEHLCRVLRELMPEEVEVGGLLALVLATDARRITRTDVAGKIVSLALQDRARWDREAIDEAMQILSEMRMDERPGPYVLQAAIALVHATAPTYDDTDWLRILDLYDELRCVWPTPVVELNRAVVISMVFGPAPALDDVDRLEKEGALSNYQYLFAIKADLLRQLGRSKEAAVADRRALELTANDAERAVLIARLDDSQ
ncbi:MAG TPA: sigma-70 family RNA polymerase sigma factor [Acidimicrobiales bacterium]|nr:sigma-70 family RNA polymerase sigma factor [Acidimicrobiales bacterium]